MVTPCGNNINCGCNDSYLTTPAPSPTPADCPDAQPCSEVFDAECVKYTGTDILCLQDTIVSTNDSVSDALVSIVDYFCTNESYISDVTLQGTNLTFTGIGLAFDGVVNLASIAGNVSANNGLTLATGNIVRLGGTLIQNTTVTTVDYDMIFTGARVSNASQILRVVNTGQGGGIYTEAQLNNGISAFSSLATAGVFTSQQSHGIQASALNGASAYAGIFQNTTTLSSSVPSVLRIGNSISSPILPTDGVGAAIDYYIPRVNNLGNKENQTSNQIQSIFTDILDATLTSALVFRGRSGGTAMKDLVTFKGDGQVQFHEYGVGTFAAAYTYVLGVDASGNIVEVTL